jgi:hypothetical protein
LSDGDWVTRGHEFDHTEPGGRPDDRRQQQEAKTESGRGLVGEIENGGVRQEGDDEDDDF